MSVNRIASRYAKSLLDLAKDQGKLERVLEDVESFKAAATDSRDFYLFLKSPIITPGKKLSILDELFKEKYDEATLAFLKIIVRKGREAYLPEIADAFIHQYKVMKNISSVTLKTAVALDQAIVDKIKEKLESSGVTHKNVDLEVEVDPALIGGFVIEFDNKRYDSSVQHHLEQLKKEFTGNIYEAKLFKN